MPTANGGELNEAAHRFLAADLGRDYRVRRVSGDASFRSYYRVERGTDRFILMDAPPDREDSRPFVDIAAFLSDHRVPVPRIHAARLETGHLLLEDFGDITLLQALNAGQAPLPLYHRAIDTLVGMQTTPRDGRTLAHGREFDRTLLRAELALFTDWYLERVLQCPLSAAQRDAYEAAFAPLLAEVLSQPRVFVHRDYHSRNLMVRADGSLGVLDFQDALMGPVTYDLASLLRDCYVAWDAPFRQEIMAYWLERAPVSLGHARDWNAFQRQFDFMAIQRNLKAIGIFGRLSRRDGKHGYLADIPRTFGYVWETLPRYKELAPLAELIQQHAPKEAVLQAVCPS
ncbi:MAG: phosphotransferase [Magnetococcus sp. WYHC-3]